MERLLAKVIVFMAILGLLAGCFTEGQDVEISNIAGNIAIDEAKNEGQAAMDYLLAEIPEINAFRQLIEANSASLAHT